MYSQPVSKPKSVRHHGDDSVAGGRNDDSTSQASRTKVPPVNQHFENMTLGDQARGHFGNQYGDQYHYHYSAKCEEPDKNISQSDLLQQLLKSLSFPEMNYRSTTIKTPSPRTGSWFLETPQYTQWRNQELRHVHRGLLWLKGMPGSGKSTIMKFVLEHGKTMYLEDKSICFFFNGSGAALESSVEGMFRSLLHQIAHHVPWLAKAVHADAVTMYGNHGWPLELLKHLFRESLRHLGPKNHMTCYIDALDECEDEDAIRNDVVGVFEDIVEADYMEFARLSVFLASRHYPNISVAGSVSIVLEKDAHHHHDIAHFVQNRLKCKQKLLRAELIARITERASGSFLWVVLTVKALNKECDHGNQHSLKSVLSTIPRDLDDLIKSIVTNGAADQRLAPALQWVTYASRPLRPKELYFAILTATNSLSPTSVICNDAVTEDTMIGDFILSSSKGLLEVVHKPETSQDSVQFMHGTIAATALLHCTTEHGDTSGSNSLRLANCCQTYLDLSFHSEARHGLDDVISRTVPRTTGQKLPATSLLTVLPFFSYALDGVLLHGGQAARLGTTVPRSLESIVCHRFWLGMKGILKQFRFPPSLLHVLTYERCASLINQDLARRPSKELQRYINEPFLNMSPLGDMRGTALQIAVARHYPDIVALLLKTGAQVNTSCSGAPHPLHIAISHHTWVTKHEDIAIIEELLFYGADVQAESNDGETALHVAMRTSLDIVEMLLKSGADIHVKDLHGDSILHTAVRLKDIRMVENCIRLGADVNATNGKAEHVLHTAVRTGAHFHMFDMLLQSGAAVDARNTVGDTVLHVAVQCKRIGMVKQCMSHGADVNARNEHGDTTLHHAVRTGETNIVTFVLAHCGDVDGRNDEGESPLHEAARNGHDKIVKLLILQGADAETLDQDNVATLCLPTTTGRAGMVKILASCGAQWEDDRATREGVDVPSGTNVVHAVTEKPFGHLSGVLADTRSTAVEELEDQVWWQSSVAGSREQISRPFNDASSGSTPEYDEREGTPPINERSFNRRILQWCDDIGVSLTSSNAEDQSNHMEARLRTSMGLRSSANTAVSTTMTRRNQSEGSYTHKTSSLRRTSSCLD